MRRVLLTGWALIAVASGVAALEIDPAAARSHAEAIATFYPRLEAGPNETELLQYLRTEIPTGVADMRVQDFSGFEGAHSFSQSLEVVVPGSDLGTLMVVTSLDHPESGIPDTDRAASVAAALALVQAAATQPQTRSIRVLFLAAEHRSADPRGLGTRRYLEEYFPDEAHALVYLDVSNSSVRLISGGNGIVTPWWLMERTFTAAANAGLTVQTEGSIDQVHRLRLTTVPVSLTSFLEAGIPSVYMTSTEASIFAPDTAETATALASFLEQWVASFNSDIPDSWDRHYVRFQLGDRPLVFREPFLVVSLIAALLLTLLYALVFRRRFNRYLRTIWRNLWNLPILILLIFAFIAVSSSIIDLLLTVRGFPTLWTHYPLAFFGLKSLLAIVLFALASTLLRRLPLSKNGSFYSAAALLLLFVDIVIFSIVNISFGIYFVWAYIAAFLFSIVPYKGVKLLALLAAPALLIHVIVTSVGNPDSELTRLLLLSPIGNVFLSFIALPFLLMLVRLDFLVRHPVKGKGSYALRIVSVVASVGALALGGILLASNPYSPSTPQPIVATERVDYANLTRTLELSSPAALDQLDVSFAGQSERVDTRDRTWEVNTPILPDVLSVRLSYEPFIDRERGELRIDAPQPLDTVEIQLFSAEPLILYDASFPFSISDDRQSATVHIGNRPQLPLAIDFTVAAGLLPGIEIRATSQEHPEPIDIRGGSITIDSVLEIITRFEQ